MLKRQVLLASPAATVTAVRCAGVGHGWSAEEAVSGSAVVLVRRGVFRRRAGGRAALADVTTGYLQRPGESEQFAHPAGGDVCSALGIGEDLADRFAAGGRITVSPEADLLHRLLLAAPLPDRACYAAELLAALLAGGDRAGIVRGSPAGGRRAGFVQGSPGERRVDEVRGLLHAAPERDLAGLAAAVGWSPWHLSRVFHRVTGMRLTAYRNRLRVRAALDDLAEAPGDGLAEIAVRRGFADQAHLTRAVRAETGGTPAALRRRLGA